MTALLARAKALVPLVLYAISEALKHGPTHLDTPGGLKAFLIAVLLAASTYVVPNKATA